MTAEEKGPIQNAIDAMLAAQKAFREYGLLHSDECAVCGSMLRPGFLHGPDCPVDGLGKAAAKLREFQRLVST